MKTPAKVSGHPVLQGAHGLTLLSTWAILLAEDAEYSAELLEGDFPQLQAADLSNRDVRLICALNHEGIHFIQALTTSHAYQSSLALLGVCKSVITDGSARRLSLKRLKKHRAEYEFIQSLHHARHRGLTAVDLLEAVAVVETYFATFIDAELAGFEQYLDMFYPGPQHEYRRIYNIVRQHFDIDVALNLIPRLCFVALNTGRPVRTFLSMLKALRSVPRHILVGDMSVISTLFGLSVGTWAHGLDPDRLRHRHQTHMFLEPYLERFRSVDRYEELFELASRPSQLARGLGPIGIAREILSPALIWHGGIVLWQGLARRWPDEMRRGYIFITQSAGLCERLLRPRAVPNKCPHFDCPFHAAALCDTWLNIPDNWNACDFPNAAASITGMELKDLCAISAAASTRSWLEWLHLK